MLNLVLSMVVSLVLSLAFGVVFVSNLSQSLPMIVLSACVCLPLSILSIVYFFFTIKKLETQTTNVSDTIFCIIFIFLTLAWFVTLLTGIYFMIASAYLLGTILIVASFIIFIILLLVNNLKLSLF